MKTQYFRDEFGHQASTLVLVEVNRALLITTSKWPDGNLTTTASVRTLREGRFTLEVSVDGLGDFYKKLEVTRPGRATAALVKAQHEACLLLLADLQQEIETHYKAQLPEEVPCVARD